MAQLYTFNQVVEIAKKAGFTADDARVAAAITLCEAPTESGGFTYADQGRVGDEDIQTDVWGPSYGMWQVRSLKAAKAGDVRYGPSLHTSADYNAKSAYAIFRDTNGRGFGEWTTYRNGAYKAYLQDLFPPKPGTYVVVSGDSFLGIDKKLGLPAGKMQSINPGINPRTLQIGQALQVPYVEQVVQPGDSLIKLMRKCGYTDPVSQTSINTVAAYAKLANPSSIYPGQTLRILKPGG